MPKRQIKKTIINYGQISDKNIEIVKKQQQSARERSRQKTPKIQVIDQSSRRAKLAALRKKNQQKEEKLLTERKQIQVKVSSDAPQLKKETLTDNISDFQSKIQETINKAQLSKVERIKENRDNIQQSDDEEEQAMVLKKPIFLSKQDRQHYQEGPKNINNQSQKALRYTTKLLLKQNEKQNMDDNEDQEIIQGSSDEQTRPNLPDDSDNSQEMGYQLWKIRELKRIRRDRQERRKIEIEKAELQRRRKMNNEQILLQNKVLGSDANQNTTETKYVYMQKYYHPGAFYRDSQDPIFNRDFNLPTPLQMQDKSLLPQLLQKRKGDFGKKGQSKYKHLSAEDTTNFNPEYRQDQTILNSFKKKMAGYKGTGGKNL